MSGVHLGPYPGAVTADPQVLWYQSPTGNRYGRPNLTVWRAQSEAYYRFVYDDGIEFVIDREGGHTYGVPGPAEQRLRTPPCT